MATLELTRVNPKTGLAAGLLGLSIVGIAFGTVNMPWLVTGAVFGMTVLAVALTAPLALVALMLMIGPLNLSFMTGGFKALFPGMGGLDMNGIRLLGATAGFVAYIMFEPRARAAAVGPLGRLWLLFLVFAGATMLTSLDRMEGMRLLLKLAYPLLTFLIVIGVADTRERAFTLLRYTLASALLFTLIINPIMALNGGYRVGFDGFLRVGGLGKGDNPFAFYVTAILLVVFSRFVLRLQLRYLLFAVVLIAWIALTVTRIAAFSAVVGMIVIGMLAALTAGNRKVLIGSLAVAGVAGMILLPNVLARSLGFVPTPGEFLEIARNPLVLYRSINWQGRELLWAILWTSVAAFPLFGRGLGSSTAIIRESFPEQSVTVAHNEYMRLATDTGLVGVLLFASAIGAWLLAAFRLSRTGDREVREFAFAAFAGIIVWGLIAITDNAFDSYTDFTQYIAFYMAAAVVVHADRRPAEAAPA